MWIIPTSLTEYILQTDTGANITLIAGTVTYTGLNPVATFIDNSAGTTMVAGKYQHLVCVFDVEDADNFEAGWDGTDYGTSIIAEIAAYSAALTADERGKIYNLGVPPDCESMKLRTIDGSRDLSVYRHTVTPYGKPVSGRIISLDGTDDRYDYGDLGNIQAIALTINPFDTTQQIVQIDTNKYIHLDSGTVTYVGLTAVATYVEGVATTTMVAGKYQRLVCVFEQVAASNFELGWDGTDFGQFDGLDLRADDKVFSAAWAARDNELNRIFV